MTTRRAFLQLGMAAAAVPLASHAARAASLDLGAERTPTLPLYKAIYDFRFAESVAFARRLAEHGVPLHGFEGDITRFWYEELDLVWRREPAVVAGLTAYGPLFCLERFAWDRRMRVVFRAVHRFDDGRIEHEVSGPSSMLSAVTDVAREPWACMADAVAQCSNGSAEVAHVRRSAQHAGITPREDVLYSWLIAPAQRT
jgi:hypothetical protein